MLIQHPTKGHLRFRPAGEGCSNYSFLEAYLPQSPGSVNDRPIHRMCSLARKMGLKTIGVEEVDVERDGNIAAEVRAIETHTGRTATARAHRFTFFAKSVDRPSFRFLPDRYFIGYAVVLQLTLEKRWSAPRTLAYVYEAIFRHSAHLDEKSKGWKGLLNNYVHVGRRFQCQAGGRTYRLTGTYFRQQNTYTAVCAHASLCMLLNNLPTMRELVTAEDINQKLGITHRGKRRVAGGLTTEQIRRVLKAYGQSDITHDFFKYPDADYAQFVYGVVESGYPCLLVTTTAPGRESHVVTVLGHTMNTDKWLPEARVLYEGQDFSCHSSVNWATHLIIHDDNFGNYLCAETNSVRRITLPSYEMRFRPRVAIGVLPCRVQARHPDVEEIVVHRMPWETLLAMLVSHPDVASMKWLPRLFRELTKGNRLVTRTFLATREAYRSHLREAKDFQRRGYTKKEVALLTAGFPVYFWVTEVSLPDLYAVNRTKLADVVVPCDRRLRRRNPFENILLLRLPGLYYNPANVPFLSFVPLGDVQSHIPLFGTDRGW